MKEQIIEWCKALAKSQGLYRRLFEDLKNNPIKLDNLAEDCERYSIKDIVDFVMFIEG